MEPWTDTMTARERIEAIALTLSQPRSVNWIKEQAEVGSWETTKSQLEHLVGMGRLEAVAIDDETRYVPDPMREYLDHIKELIVGNSKEDLRDELQLIVAETEAWKAEYDVESLAELDASLGEARRSTQELKERRKTIAYWEENEQYRQILVHALQLYDDLMAMAHDPTIDPAEA